MLNSFNSRILTVTIIFWALQLSMPVQLLKLMAPALSFPLQKLLQKTFRKPRVAQSMSQLVFLVQVVASENYVKMKSIS